MGLSAAYHPMPSEEQSIELIKHAYDQGVTFFDTSDFVWTIHKWSVSWKGRRGISKKPIHNFIFKNIYIVLYWRMFFFVLLWFTKALKLLPREKIQLATKFGNVFENGELVVKGGRDYVRKACEDSLNRLNVDYIDLYYQHRVDTSVPIEETVCMHINGRKSDPFFSNRSI